MSIAASGVAKYQARKRLNAVALVLSLAAMAFGLVWLIWILFETVRLGIGGLTWATVSQMTPAPNEVGGIANAIYGSFLMVMLATFVATPIGILAGVYLVEYDREGWLGRTTRFVNDILLSAPSIVIGLFVYAVVVAMVVEPAAKEEVGVVVGAMRPSLHEIFLLPVVVAMVGE